MEIAVKETYAHMLKDESLVQNAETLYIVEFLFDKSWDGYTKTAIFKAGSVELSVKLTDDRCIIPAECLKQAGVSLHIGVSGVKGGEQKVKCSPKVGQKLCGKAILNSVLDRT